MKFKPELAKSFLHISMWTFWTPHSQGLSRDFELFAHGQAANCLMSEASPCPFFVGSSRPTSAIWLWENTKKNKDLRCVIRIHRPIGTGAGAIKSTGAALSGYLLYVGVVFVDEVRRVHALTVFDSSCQLAEASKWLHTTSSHLIHQKPYISQIGQLPRCNRNRKTQTVLSNQPDPGKSTTKQPLIPLITEDPFFFPKVSLMAAPEPPPSWRRRFSLSASRTMVQWAWQIWDDE